MGEMTKKVWIITIVGLILGASIGYFYRPPALFIGQLPFDVVITRGGNLKGLDQIYLEIAKTSFNYLLIGGIAGAIIGAIVGMKTTKNISNKTS
jgi:Na+/H+ antiporter NhaC